MTEEFEEAKVSPSLSVTCSGLPSDVTASTATNTEVLTAAKSCSTLTEADWLETSG